MTKPFIIERFISTADKMLYIALEDEMAVKARSYLFTTDKNAAYVFKDIDEVLKVKDLKKALQEDKKFKIVYIQ